MRDTLVSMTAMEEVGLLAWLMNQWPQLLSMAKLYCSVTCLLLVTGMEAPVAQAVVSTECCR